VTFLLPDHVTNGLNCVSAKLVEFRIDQSSQVHDTNVHLLSLTYHLNVQVIYKLARSRSSPSPPPAGGEFARTHSVKLRQFRKRHGSFIPDSRNTVSPMLEVKKDTLTRATPLDWSTSYQAGSSGCHLIC
jgi:hypothetical protein